MRQAPIPRSRDPGAPKELQLKFRLSRELHDSIAEAAERSGRSVSQEIRRRLEVSGSDDRELAGLIEAVKLAAPAGWHSRPRPFAIFREAIGLLLRQFQPRGEVSPREAAAIAQEGAVMAGAALGAVGIRVQLGEAPSRLAPEAVLPATVADAIDALDKLRQGGRPVDYIDEAKPAQLRLAASFLNAILDAQQRARSKP